MASQQDLDFTYTTIDKIFRLSIGQTGDYNGAMYNGDFSLTLEQAQRQKHAFIADSLRVGSGSRVLDLGCGWGGFLQYVKERNATGQGVTLSKGQAAACRGNRLSVHIKDCRQIRPADYGRFDVISSVGTMEHFCSVEQYQAGQQDAVYAGFFAYIQTMVLARI